MEIKYVAVDEKTFDTEKECIQHEGETIGFKLYDIDGDITYDTEDTVYIYCEDNEALEHLLNMEIPPYGLCFKFDSHDASISVAESLWEWNDQQHKFQLVDNALIEVIKHHYSN